MTKHLGHTSKNQNTSLVKLSDKISLMDHSLSNILKIKQHVSSQFHPLTLLLREKNPPHYFTLTSSSMAQLEESSSMVL